MTKVKFSTEDTFFEADVEQRIREMLDEGWDVHKFDLTTKGSWIILKRDGP